MQNQDRIIWADSLKGALIILVVLGHSIQEVLGPECFNNHIWNLIYSFHMPAFMAISGYLNYRTTGIRNRISLLNRRFQQLMIPFFLWALIRILINPPYSAKAFVDVILYLDGAFWFLWVLFFISLLFYFGDWLAEKLNIKQEWIIGALCILLASLMVIADIRILGFQYISYYFLFYSIGFYLHKYSGVLTSKDWLLFVLFALWLLMAWNWNMHKLPDSLAIIPLPQSVLLYAYRFVVATIAIYVLVCVSPRILNTPNKWNSLFIKCGIVSLGIYTTHILIMPFVVNSIYAFTSETVLVVLLSFVIALSLSWLIVYLLSKWNVSSKLLLGKI